MALIAYDGYDHFASPGDMQLLTGTIQYPSVSAATISNSGGGRSSTGKSISFGGNEVSFISSLNVNPQQLTVGFGLNFGGGNGAITIPFQDAYTGTTQCSFVFNTSTGQASIVNAAGVTIKTALNVIYPQGWMFVECQAFIASGTGGFMDIHINGQPTGLLTSGINTQASANAGAGKITWYSAGLFATMGFSIDDTYYADGTTGPGAYPNNGFLGDVRCATLFPVSNNSVTWAPLANANWQEVSNINGGSDAAYNRTDVAGAKDSFNFGPLDVDVNKILGVQVTMCVRKEDAGARTISPIIVIAGVTYYGTITSAGAAVDVSYIYITSNFAINPATSASWTAADINGLQAGYIVAT